MDGAEAAVATSGQYLAGAMAEGWFRSLLIDGVWAGVGSVLVFLPQILILFFFIAILEDSGYMARAAVIADRLMHRVGCRASPFSRFFPPTRARFPRSCPHAPWRTSATG